MQLWNYRLFKGIHLFFVIEQTDIVLFLCSAQRAKISDSACLSQVAGKYWPPPGVIFLGQPGNYFELQVNAELQFAWVWLSHNQKVVLLVN